MMGVFILTTYTNDGALFFPLTPTKGYLCLPFDSNNEALFLPLAPIMGGIILPTDTKDGALLFPLTLMKGHYSYHMTPTKSGGEGWNMFHSKNG